MEKFLTFGVVGLALAAVYSVMASGLVVTYTTTGIFNFAHGAVGMFAAFTYWQFRVDWGWPAPVALIVVLLVLAPLFGVFLDWLVMSRIRGAGEAVKLVVSISLLMAIISGARWIWDPAEPRTLTKFFPQSEPIDLGVTTITIHQAITIVVAIVVAIGLRLLMYRTRIGLAMRASVDDPGLAVLNGAKPEAAARAAWALGSTLAAVGGVLIAPNVSMDAPNLSLVILSAYAAAVVGRLRSVPMAFLGALIVACTESYLLGYLPTSPYLYGLRLASPALLLFIVLLVMPQQRLRSRVRSRESFPVPNWRGTLMFAAGVLVFASVLASTLTRSDEITYGKIFSIALIALSLVPLVGYSGQISLCQLSLAGLGGIAYARLGDASLLGLVWAMVIPAAIGIVIALPALRLQGIYLALSTAAFAMAVDKWFFGLRTFEVFGWFQISFFGQGSVAANPPSLPGIDLKPAGAQMMFAAVLFVLATLVVVAIRRSFFGRRLIAIRDSEAACAALGGNLVVAKMSVFAMSAAIAGLGGAMWSIQSQNITAENFSFIAGLNVFVTAVIGGVAMLGGALFAGVALVGALPVMVTLAESLENVAAISIGLAGMGLGQNPNGTLPLMRHRWDDIIATRLMTGIFLAFFSLTWGLRLLDVYSGWTFVAILALGSLVIRSISTQVAYRRRNGGPIRRTPLEQRGLVAPWSSEDLAEIEWGMAWSAGEQR